MGYASRACGASSTAATERESRAPSRGRGVAGFMCGLDVWGRKVPASIAFAWVVACGRADVTHAPAPEPAFASSPLLTPPLPVSSPALAAIRATVAWPELVRDEQWDGAWGALEALPEADKSRPEVRYARARVALARSDAAT